MPRIHHLACFILPAVALLVAGEVRSVRTFSQPQAGVEVEASQSVADQMPEKDALLEAVEDGDLPRVQKLLAATIITGEGTHPRAAELALSIVERTRIRMCGTGYVPPRVPYTRARFLPVFQFLVRHAPKAGNVGAGTGEPLLFAAASLGDIETVRHLVGRGADAGFHGEVTTVIVGHPDPTEIGGGSLLLEAIRSGWRDDNPDPTTLVRYLLTQGANPNAMEAGRDSPLQAGARFGSLAVVRALLEAGADPNARTDDGRSALGAAQQYKHREVVALLSPLTTRDLFEAVADNDVDAVRKLLDAGNGVGVNAVRAGSGETALMVAAKDNAGNAATLLLDRGAGVASTDREGKTALHIAAQTGSDTVAKLLLARGADANAPVQRKDENGKPLPADKYSTRSTPLRLAIDGGNVAVAERLLKHGVRIDAQNANTVAESFVRTAGRTAPTSDLLDDTQQRVLSPAERDRLLNALVAAGLPLKTTPLAAFAASTGSPELLRYLLDKGALPDMPVIGERAGDEWAALSSAISYVSEARQERQLFADEMENAERASKNADDEKKGRECFRLLLARGADVNARTAAGKTVLMRATEIGAFDLADQLLRRRADINATDANGRTALIRAVSEPDFADEVALHYLLKRGANRDLRDNKGDTALTIAKRHNLKNNAIALLAKK